MKNIIKNIGLAILGLIALVLIVAVFVSGDVKYEKTIRVSSSIKNVWPHVNSLASLDKWSPWNDYDPNIKKEYIGADGAVGAMVTWDSPVEEVGKGSQKITKIENLKYFETDLKFYTPYESEAVSYIKLSDVSGQTEITWGFKSEMPYPFRITKLFIDMGDMIGEDFDNGLNKLKTLCESSS